MAEFNIAYKITAGHEGGYVNDPTDNGGETINGISRKNFPNLLLWKKIDEIKKRVGVNPNAINSEVKNDFSLQTMIREFYKSSFWDVNKLDFVKSQSIANEMYDTGVNMGTGTAAKFLQEALNLCNKNGISYPDVSVDGKIGSNGETMIALNTKANETAILNTFNMLQGEKYLNIMRANKAQEKFWFGWLKRVVVTDKW